MIEPDDRRVDQLKTGVRSVMWLGVVVPAVLVLPVQWMVIHRDALLVLVGTIRG